MKASPREEIIWWEISALNYMEPALEPLQESAAAASVNGK